MSCLTIDGLARICGGDPVAVVAPAADNSPLVDWASERGLDNWLMKEARWLRQQGLWGDETPIRNRMVERAVPGAIEFCMERVRAPDHENKAHYDVDSLLRLHPKPLPEAVLDACVEVARMRCHPDRYQHRIEALRLLVEAANSGSYSKTKVARLVLELAQSEPDPDVRIAAIDLVPWTGTGDIRQVLAEALTRESGRIQQAALKAVNGSMR